jgi:hypothetical protein
MRGSSLAYFAVRRIDFSGIPQGQDRNAGGSD